ncbi:hypothetical protein SORBI_3003G120050 [Sorghum bicolor]|uniref:Uncharacterized protein n=1 Tax=Sorghum bicolor TaxID=4558 RepID=A0A1W0VWZ2_SORBI|nr:hypothetical protein SORBI_3003G120050 [Sorghum bicolor]
MNPQHNLAVDALVGSAIAAAPKPKSVSVANEVTVIVGLPSPMHAASTYPLGLVLLHPVHQLLEVLVVVRGPRHGEAAAREGHHLNRQRHVVAVRQLDPPQGRARLSIVQARQRHAGGGFPDHELRALVAAVDLGEAGARVGRDAAGEQEVVVQQGRQASLARRWPRRRRRTWPWPEAWGRGRTWRPGWFAGGDRDWRRRRHAARWRCRRPSRDGGSRLGHASPCSHGR